MVKLILLLVGVLCLGGCSSEPAYKGQPRLVVSNYNYQGAPVQVGLEHIPEKALVCGEGGVETLIALGAQSHIKAALIRDKAFLKRHQDKLNHAAIYSHPLGAEEALHLQPDFILGWRRYFSPKALGDTVNWHRRGIPAYIQDASGPIPALGPFPPCTIASEKNFIKNMGKIFAKEKEAQQLITAIDNTLDQYKQAQGPSVLVVEFLGRSIEVFGRELLAGDIITRLGGRLIETDQPFISKETLVNLRPQVIILVYHGQEQEKQLALAQMQQHLYRHLPAVQQQRLYPIEYNHLVAPGSGVKKTIELLGRALYTASM